MATSARTAALREQRNRYVSRKVLRPGSLRASTNSIARKLADAEFESMVNKYQAGLVGNEEMLAFLESSYNSDLFTPNEKVDIEKRLLDFEGRVRGDNLEAIYEASVGPSKVEAANNLSQFYQDRAAEMEVGTPAHSNSLASAAKWQQKAIAEEETQAKERRKESRAQKLFQISQLPSDSVDTLQQKYEAYKALSEEAAADGATIEAYDYAADANKIVNEDIPKLQEKQAKEVISTTIDQIKNDYHDGAISALDAASQMKQLDDLAMENGIYDYTGTINSFADSLQNDIEKGVTRGNIEGLEYSIRKSGNAYTADIKQWKERFALEDDVFRQYMAEAERDPIAADRLYQKMNLYSAYMTGYYLDGSEADEFMGLPARADAYQVWHDNTDADYSNEIRDNTTKINKYGEDLASVIYQYSGIVGPQGDDVVARAVSILPEGARFTPGQSGSQGVMVTYDEFGREYEKPISLNSQLITTDDAGNQIVEGTQLGTDIAMTPDGRYVKLTPVFANESDKVLGKSGARFFYTIYNGQYYIKQPGSDELIPAAQAAQEDSDIAGWYQTVQAQDVEMQRRWAEINGQPQASQESMEPETDLQLGDQRQVLPPQPPLQESVFSQAGSGQFDPLTQDQARATIPTIPDLNIEPSTVTPSYQAPNIADFSPSKDIGVGYGAIPNLFNIYQPSKASTPEISAGTTSQYSYTPYELPTSAYTNPYSNYYQPTQQNQGLYNAGTSTFGLQSPGSNIQNTQDQQLSSQISTAVNQDQTPFNFEIKPTPQEKLVSGVKNAATGAWDWLKGLFQ